MSFRLVTLGDLRLLAPDGSEVSFPIKGLAAICYLLASAREEVARGNLARMLWESSDPGTPFVNLRKTISRIAQRQGELGLEFLRFTPEAVLLDGARLTCDLTDLSQVDVADPVKRLEHLLAMLRREFLDTLEFQTPAFANWVQQVRGSHVELLFETLKDASLTASTATDKAMMKEAAVYLLRADPTDKYVHQLLLETFAADGEVETFRRIFERRKNAIWGELTLSPDGGTLDLARRRAERRYAEAGASGVAFRTPEQADIAMSRAAIPRVALLPPTETGSVGSISAMAELLLQDVTIGLSSARSLRVVAPFSCAKLSRHANKIALVKQHEISYVLDTRLSAATETAIFAQLIHIADDSIVWAERFSVKSGDLPSQRQEIGRRVARSVIGEVHRNEMARIHVEQNPVAYHHYLVGQHHLQSLALPDIRRARKEFKAALRESEYFAPAFSGLARSHSREWLLTARGDTEHLDLAEKYANQAIAAGQDVAAGYRELGVIKLFLGDFDESIAALEIAETLSPHHADVIADHADTLVLASRPAEGLEKIELAIDLNPLCPDHYHWKAAGANYQLERYEDALTSISRMENDTPAARLAAASWAMLGNRTKAKTFVRKVRESNPDFDIDAWLAVVPIRDQQQRDHYRQGLRKAGF